MKRRFVRDSAELSDDDAVVVRGGVLEPDGLRADALRHHAIYGTYGISVFAAHDITIDELAQQPPLIRFERLTVTTAGALRRRGLRLDPTGRNPRHYTVGFDDLDDGIDQVRGCEHRVIINPYHEP